MYSPILSTAEAFLEKLCWASAFLKVTHCLECWHKFNEPLVSYRSCMMMSDIFHNTFQAVIFIDRFITQPRQYHPPLILRLQYCQGQRCCHETHLAERGFGKINWVFRACTFRLLYLKHSDFWSASSYSVRFFLLQVDNSSTWILLLLLSDNQRNFNYLHNKGFKIAEIVEFLKPRCQQMTTTRV